MSPNCKDFESELHYFEERFLRVEVSLARERNFREIVEGDLRVKQLAV